MDSSDITKECKKLEKELQKYKLWANLVPSGSWGESLYRLMEKKEWDIVRKSAYAHYNHSCAICGQSGITLYGHEDWKYDYTSSIQQLNDILALCNLCHMCNHLGFAGIQASKGRLDYTELIDHWCKINSASKDEFKEHERVAFKLWNLRSEFEWKVVDSRGKEISEKPSSADILNGLWKKGLETH